MLRSGLRGMLVLVVVTGLIGAAPRSTLAASASRSSVAGRIGVAGSLIFSSPSDMLRQAQQLHALGIHWLSETFYWSMIEPARGRFAWGQPDALMTAAAKTGTEVLAVLAYSAPWASSDPSSHHSPDFPPRHPSDYAQYAAAVVRRYGLGGTFWAAHPGLTASPIRAVEIWNEPWWQGFWRPAANADAYARLVRVAGASIRHVGPSVTILVSGDLNEPNPPDARTWLARLLTARPSVAPYVDAWSVHPYPDPKNLSPTDGPTDSSFQRVAVIAKLVRAAHIDRPIWITEIGWSSAPETPGGVTERVQAQYLREALHEALTAWRGVVARTFVYAWGRDAGSGGDLYGHFGLYDDHGHPKPALAAVSAAVRGH